MAAFLGIVESMFDVFDFRGDRNMLIFRSIKDESRVFCKNKSYIRIETRSNHSKLPDVIPISSFRCRLENVTMRENLDKLD